MTAGSLARPKDMRVARKGRPATSPPVTLTRKVGGRQSTEKKKPPMEFVVVLSRAATGRVNHGVCAP